MAGGAAGAAAGLGVGTVQYGNDAADRLTAARVEITYDVSLHRLSRPLIMQFD